MPTSDYRLCIKQILDTWNVSVVAKEFPDRQIYWSTQTSSVYERPSLPGALLVIMIHSLDKIFIYYSRNKEKNTYGTAMASDSNHVNPHLTTSLGSNKETLSIKMHHVTESQDLYCLYTYVSPRKSSITRHNFTLFPKERLLRCHSGLHKMQW